MVERATPKYPIQVSNGRIMLSTGTDIEKDAIFSVLETRQYERVMRPLSYGTKSYIFDTISATSVIPARVEVALRSQIPNLRKIQVTGSFDESGVQQLKIYWEDKDFRKNDLKLSVS
jgi:phage baseplate assembly protein W